MTTYFFESRLEGPASKCFIGMFYILNILLEWETVKLKLWMAIKSSVYCQISTRFITHVISAFFEFLTSLWESHYLVLVATSCCRDWCKMMLLLLWSINPLLLLTWASSCFKPYIFISYTLLFWSHNTKPS